MIVKNEGHIIEKTLENLCSYINFNYWVICDTGSEDKTIEIIENFFKKKNINGEIHRHVWEDFASNRTKAIELAYNKSDYVLIFDADDSIVGNFKLPEKLEKKMYHLFFDGGVKYKRPLLLYNRIEWKWKGVVHEFIITKDDKEVDQGLIDGDYHLISGREGNRNKNPKKYLSDALLLEKGFYKEIDGGDYGLATRYAFYIAQSYSHSNIEEEKEKSIYWYKKVVELKGWKQEKYLACFHLGIYYMDKNDYEKTVEFLSKAAEFDPERLESIVKLVEFFFKKDNHTMVNVLYQKFKFIKKPNDKLFLVNFYYNNVLEYYNSISGYYVEDKISSYICCKKIIEEYFKKPLEKIFVIKTVENLLNFKDFIENDKKKMTLFKSVNKILPLLFEENSCSVLCQKVWNMLKDNVEDELTLYKDYKFENRKNPKIMISFTTCKRLNLFQKTIQSIINTWSDIQLIDYWFCVDDNSCEEDKQIMKTNYKWIDFVFKNQNEKGHKNSMKIIWRKIKELNIKYWIHMEDDFLFFDTMNYVSYGIEGLDTLKEYNVKQILFNNNYAETIQGYNIKGSKKINEKFSIHEYLPNREFDYLNNHYWPHYSLRPSIIDTESILKIGNYTLATSQFFEMEYASLYAQNHYKSGFFNKITNVHIGKLTNDKNKDNAYTLNNEKQFEQENIYKKYKTYVINLDEREDRLQYMQKNLPFEFERFSAINGKHLNLYPLFSKFLKKLDTKSIIEGEIALKLSNYCIWTTLKDHTILLEDDICINNIQNFEKVLSSLSILDVDWDIIYIGGQYTKQYNINSETYYKEHKILQEHLDNKMFEKVYDGFYRRNLNINNDSFYSPTFRATGSYIVNKKSGKKLLDLCEQDIDKFIEMPLDMLLLQWQKENKIISLDYLEHPFYQVFGNDTKENSILKNDIDRSKIFMFKYVDYNFRNIVDYSFIYRYCSNLKNIKCMEYGCSDAQYTILINYYIKNFKLDCYVLDKEKFHQNFDKVNIRKKVNLYYDIEKLPKQKKYDYIFYTDQNLSQTTIEILLGKLEDTGIIYIPLIDQEFINTLDDKKYIIEKNESNKYILIHNLKISEKFSFFPKKDIIGEDLFYFNQNMNVMLLQAYKNKECVAVNTLGFFKKNLSALSDSPYFSETDGIYIKKDMKKEYVKQGKKKTKRIKMIGNFWDTSKDLCNEFNLMLPNRDFKFDNYEITSDNENIDFYIIINKPKHDDVYIPNKTLVFTMEPDALDSPYGTHTWKEWYKPSKKKFLYVHDLEHNLNLVQWKLQTDYSIISNDIENKEMNKIASILSWKTFFDGHKKRVEFIDCLSSYGLIDVFGRSNHHHLSSYKGKLKNDDPASVMLRYKYYFMNENNSQKNYITEKLWEPILCECLVFYWGCPNVGDYINPEAIVILDIDNIKESIQIVKKAIKENWWLKKLPLIRQEKQKILNEYSFQNTIKNILDKY